MVLWIENWEIFKHKSRRIDGEKTNNTGFLVGSDIVFLDAFVNIKVLFCHVGQHNEYGEKCKCQYSFPQVNSVRCYDGQYEKEPNIGENRKECRNYEHLIVFDSQDFWRLYGTYTQSSDHEKVICSRSLNIKLVLFWVPSALQSMSEDFFLTYQQLCPVPIHQLWNYCRQFQ